MRIVRVKYFTLDYEKVEMDVTSDMCINLGLANDEEEMILAAIRYARSVNEKHIEIESVKIIAD